VLNSIIAAYTKIPYVFGGGFALPPVNLTFELTYRCNLDCRICYLKATGARNHANANDELTLNEIKNALEILTRNIPFSKNKLSHVLFTGGEIFLRDDIIDILRIAAGKANVSIFTNGLLLTDNIINALMDLKLEKIMISLDGPPEIHDTARNKKGAFNKASAAIARIAGLKEMRRQKKPLIQITTVISEINAESLPELIPIAEKIRVDELVFACEDTSRHRWLGAMDVDDEEFMNMPPNLRFKDLNSLKNSLDRIEKEAEEKGAWIKIRPYGFSRDVINQYLNKYDIRDYICYYPWSTMRISAYGDIFPCYRFKIGSLRKDGFERLNNMWNADAYVRFRKKVKRNGPFFSCLGCGCLTRR